MQCRRTRPSPSGGPWRTLRPAVGPRSGSGDYEERTPELGAASGVVALAADLINHGVGGSGDAEGVQELRKSAPNRALYPTGAGRRMNASG